MLTVNNQRVKCRPPVVVALNRFLQPATWRACADIFRDTLVPAGMRGNSRPATGPKQQAGPAPEVEPA